MARKITQLPNTIAAGGNYSYGDIRDNDGTNNGTPVDSEVYSDKHQFFDRLLDKGGVVANGLPDNDLNGYQLYEAFLNLRSRYTCTSATSNTIGTGLLSFTVPDSLSYYVGVPIRITRTSVTSTYMLGLVASYTATTLQVLVIYTSGTGTFTDWTINLGQTPPASLADVNTGTNETYPVTPKTLADTPTVINAQSSVKLQYEELPIFGGGLGWDMNVSAFYNLSHGITNWETIKVLAVNITNDAGTATYDLSSGSITAVELEVASIDSTNIVLNRLTGGFFDSTDFDDDSIVRGFVCVIYQ